MDGWRTARVLNGLCVQEDVVVTNVWQRAGSRAFPMSAVLSSVQNLNGQHCRQMAGNLLPGFTFI